VRTLNRFTAFRAEPNWISEKIKLNKPQSIFLWRNIFNSDYSFISNKPQQVQSFLRKNNLVHSLVNAKSVTMYQIPVFAQIAATSKILDAN
jgi:hypothetical protein